MGQGKRLSSKTLFGCLLMLMIVCEMTSPSFGCPTDGDGCRNCIVNHMKVDCPKCAPIMRCMAKCLWGGTSRTKCTKKCDCKGVYPRLSDCKNCLSQCKCSCSSV
ncbi:PREDICTED: uncharacterized protein LOC109242719 [Nicotiana attenuata]|uniref:uncharacterized protein LOC109242719 n=1 Tax=Nicotiana attenuata TaxID=49451 RepID=UPI0009049C2E|nr:PREDICTED: uncharacterized protein LOC109242719 [Nicotiana attenuata]